MSHYPEVVAFDFDNTITQTPPSEIHVTEDINQLKINFSKALPRDGIFNINKLPFIPLIITGRTETFRDVTQEWLTKNTIWNYRDIIMLHDAFYSNGYNHEDYVDWKVQTFIDHNVNIVVDDVPEIIDLCEENGITSFLVEKNMNTTIERVLTHLRSI